MGEVQRNGDLLCHLRRTIGLVLRATSFFLEETRKENRIFARMLVLKQRFDDFDLRFLAVADS